MNFTLEEELDQITTKISNIEENKHHQQTLLQLKEASESLLLLIDEMLDNCKME